MNLLTIEIQPQIRKGGDILMPRGLNPSASSTAPTSGDGSFAGILNEKKGSTDQAGALPVNPDREPLQGESFSSGTNRKEFLTQGDTPSVPSGGSDLAETRVSDSTAPETIDETAASLATQSAATASLNQASPESLAAVAPGNDGRVRAKGSGIPSGSPEYPAVKGGHDSGAGPVLDAEKEGLAGTQDSSISLKKQISPTAVLAQEPEFTQASDTAVRSPAAASLNGEGLTDRMSKSRFAATVMTQNHQTTHVSDTAARSPAPASLNGEGLPERNISPLRGGAFVPQEQAAVQHAAAKQGRQGAQPSMDHAAANPTLVQDESSPEGITQPRVLETDLLTRKEPATLPFKEASAASARLDRHSTESSIEPKSGMVTSGQTESKGTLMERAVAMKEGPAPVAGQINDGDENKASGTMRTVHATGRDAWHLRADWINTAYAPEAEAPLSGTLPAQRTQAVIDQIMNARQTMNGDFGRVRIVLNPPNLGVVDLQIVMRGERVEVVMRADNAGVQQALLSRAEDIRFALERNDLKIDAFQVLLEEQTADQRQAHGGSMFEQRRENQEKHNLKNSDLIPTTNIALSAIEVLKPASGQVSIFV